MNFDCWLLKKRNKKKLNFDGISKGGERWEMHHDAFLSLQFKSYTETAFFNFGINTDCTLKNIVLRMMSFAVKSN